MILVYSHSVGLYFTGNWLSLTSVDCFYLVLLYDASNYIYIYIYIWYYDERVCLLVGSNIKRMCCKHSKQNIFSFDVLHFCSDVCLEAASRQQNCCLSLTLTFLCLVSVLPWPRYYCLGLISVSSLLHSLDLRHCNIYFVMILFNSFIHSS